VCVRSRWWLARPGATLTVFRDRCSMTPACRLNTSFGKRLLAKIDLRIVTEVNSSRHRKSLHWAEEYQEAFVEIKAGALLVEDPHVGTNGGRSLGAMQLPATARLAQIRYEGIARPTGHGLLRLQRRRAPAGPSSCTKQPKAANAKAGKRAGCMDWGTGH